jgi:hypothetical protein
MKEAKVLDAQWDGHDYVTASFRYEEAGRRVQELFLWAAGGVGGWSGDGACAG